MEDSNERRVPWTTRINIRPSAQELVRRIAETECISVATIIGRTIENYITARST
jgi:hypothetical protein